jgi:hypothetical protein
MLSRGGLIWCLSRRLAAEPACACHAIGQTELVAAVASHCCSACVTCKLRLSRHAGIALSMVLLQQRARVLLAQHSR